MTTKFAPNVAKYFCLPQKSTSFYKCYLLPSDAPGFWCLFSMFETLNIVLWLYIGMSRRENDNGKVACFAYTFFLLLSVYNAWIKAINLESVWAGNKTKSQQKLFCTQCYWLENWLCTQNHFSTLLSTISQFNQLSQSYGTVQKKFANNSWRVRNTSRVTSGAKHLWPRAYVRGSHKHFTKSHARFLTNMCKILYNYSLKTEHARRA